MATVKDSTYTYTVSTPATITINESNINTNFVAGYTPTVTRNKTGSAVTRYIVFAIGTASVQYNLACWKVTFAANSKTGSVSQQSSFGNTKFGDVANTTVSIINVGLDTTPSLSYYQDSVDVACTKKLVFYPSITLTVNRTQSYPAPNTFGYRIGFCSATVTMTIKNSWTYDYGSVSVPISTSSISGGGKSASGTTGTTVTLNLGVLASLTTAITATAKNNLGYTATATASVTCQEYTAPQITAKNVVRNVNDEENATITASFKIHSMNQEGTTGAISINWTVKDGNTTIVSGTATIYASGTAASSLTGNVTIPITGDLLNENTNYSLDMTITDRATTSGVIRDFISSTFRLLHLHQSGEGIGIGGAAPSDGLEIYSDMYIHDEGALYTKAAQLGFVSSADIDLRDLLLKILNNL